jgi:RNase P subunit RPR2
MTRNFRRPQKPARTSCQKCQKPLVPAQSMNLGYAPKQYCSTQCRNAASYLRLKARRKLKQ